MARDDWRKAIDKRAAIAREARLHKLGIRPTEKPKLPRNPSVDDLRRLGLGFHDS
jgi:hypothetical protein